MDRFLGAEPDRMRRAARLMDDEAATLHDTFRAIDGRLKGAWWQGQDATQFHQRWEQHHRTRMLRAVEALRTSAEELRRQALQQEQASS